MATEVNGSDVASGTRAVTPGRRPVATYRTNLILAILSIWFVIGLFLDAWAHNNVPKLESFFTPWHAVFYSGFSATAAFVLWTCRGALRDGQPARAALPVGYGPTVIAVGVFAVAAFADLVWHTLFGIEQAITILFSPTHLLLLGAMVTIVTTPIRSMWADRTLARAPGLRQLLPVVLSTVFATTLVLLFLQYSNALTLGSRAVVAGLSYSDRALTTSLVASVAMTNLVLVVPLLTLARRWRLPIGTATILYAAIGGLSAAVTGLRNLPLIGCFVIAGVCVDALAVVLRPDGTTVGRLRAFGAGTSLVTWTIFVSAAAALAPAPLAGNVNGHPESALELWTGVPIVQALMGWLIAILLVPTAQPGTSSVEVGLDDVSDPSSR